MQQQFENALSALPELLQDSVRRGWDEFLKACGEAKPDIADEVVTSLAHVWAASDYVMRRCIHSPQIVLQLLDSGDLQRSYQENELNLKLAKRLQDVSNEADLFARLRQFRHGEMVRIIWRDIAGWAELMETTRDLTHLADSCLELALEQLYAWHSEQFGTPCYADGRPMNLVVLGMGKLGAWELNVSSDIDLIFTFADEGETRGGPRALSHSEFFTRLGRKLISALDEQTADGRVFRVDMRLRPFGDGGPLVSSFEAMETYYQIHGREWERYAMIKARVVAGDKQAGEQLMAMLQPFVYRRYLDFGAYESLRDMKAMISREVKRKGMERNVKLGAGGIREVEFIAQLFQLIRGGREPALQERRLLVVLDVLKANGSLPDYVVNELTEAYVFLRNTEHRLQEYADQQTHNLPEDKTAQCRLAMSMGYPDWTRFAETLERCRQRVHSHFEQVFEAPQSTEEREGDNDFQDVWLGHLEREPALKLLAEAGYQDSESIYLKITELKRSRLYHSLSSNGRARLDRLMPLLLGAAVQFEQADIAFSRVLEIVMHVARRSVYLALLVENPLALSQLVKLCGASPWLTRYLKQYPLLLDELIDVRTLYAPPGKAELRNELITRMASVPAADHELAMDSLRQFRHTNVLRVAAADLAGALPIMKVSDHLSWIAETVLDEALEQAWTHMLGRHGRPACELEGEVCDKGFAVVAYGKLGGLELGYSSDLDLVFLHASEDANAMTEQITGHEKPLAIPVFYARLGQRLIHILTAHTSGGVLYEVDMRLRPDGASGMLVSNLSAFERYQLTKAWLWEHQALVRARVVAGDPRVAEQFQRIRHATLTQPRERATLRDEVCAMRQRMRQELCKQQSGLFDLKQGIGGIVDIEFIVQFEVLASAHEYPQLIEFTDNIRLLEGLATAGLMPAAEVELLSDAYRAYRSHFHRRALQEEEGLVDDSLFLAQRTEVSRIWIQHLES